MYGDLDLQREVLDELDYEPSVNAAAIGVTVSDGVVTLTGHVQSFAEKLAAERAVKRVHGVKGVAVELDVKVPFALQRDDGDLARAALDALKWNSSVPKDRVKVKVEDGWVTLEGDLQWEYQREAAARAVRFLEGVRGVTNLIALRPAVATAEIKERITSAFRRSAELDAQGIAIEAHDGTVKLTGTVHSWSERSEAERIAWAATGVSLVDNAITVAA
jgi:osmotically-inducible protein OsmY